MNSVNLLSRQLTGMSVRDRGEVGIRGLARIKLLPHRVASLIQPTIEVAEHDKRMRASRGLVDPAFQDGNLAE